MRTYNLLRSHVARLWRLRDIPEPLRDASAEIVAHMESVAPNAQLDVLGREVAELRDRLKDLLNGTRQGGQRMLLCDTCQLDLELALTAQFFRFADKRYGGVVGKDLRELDWFMP